MAKKAYIGVDGVARKIKKGYVGVDGKARKIKKAYIGIGGVARPCWSGGELAYYGAITPLSQGRYGTAAATVGGNAVVVGGTTGSAVRTAEFYNESLTRSDATSIAFARYNLSGASVGNYALFAGGRNGTTRRTEVDAYNSSLVKSTATALSQGRSYAAPGRVGDYALFIGGEKTNTDSSQYVEAYSSTLTKKKLTNLSLSFTESLSAASVGNYCVFNHYKSNGLYAYDTSLTLITIGTSFTERRYQYCAASIDGFAIFAGGVSSSSGITSVDVVNESLTVNSTATISSVRSYQTPASMNKFAVFASDENYVDVFDESLTNTTVQGFTNGRFSSAAVINNFALFFGGNANSYSDVVTAYVAT